MLIMCENNIGSMIVYIFSKNKYRGLPIVLFGFFILSYGCAAKTLNGRYDLVYPSCQDTIPIALQPSDFNLNRSLLLLGAALFLVLLLLFFRALALKNRAKILKKKPQKSRL